MPRHSKLAATRCAATITSGRWSATVLVGGVRGHDTGQRWPLFGEQTRVGADKSPGRGTASSFVISKVDTRHGINTSPALREVCEGRKGSKGSKGSKGRKRGWVRWVPIPASDAWLYGDMVLPGGVHGSVLFAHGSGSGRHSVRCRHVAQHLHHAVSATLLFDVLTAQEEQTDLDTPEHRFNIPLLAQGMQDAAALIRELRAPPNIFVVRKRGLPGQEEYGTLRHRQWRCEVRSTATTQNATERHSHHVFTCLAQQFDAVRTHRRNQRRGAAERRPGAETRRGAGDLSVRCLIIQEIR